MLANDNKPAKAKRAFEEKFARELELEGVVAPAWSFFKRNAAKFLEHGTVENLVSDFD